MTRPPETQVKLLRVLEDRVVSRLGENEWHQVDFRLHRRDEPRPGAAHRGWSVWRDLYERLAIVRIHLRRAGAARGSA
jgi:DNA-binding NtrC family response regulator